MKRFNLCSKLKSSKVYEINVYTVSKHTETDIQSQVASIESNFKCRHVAVLLGFGVFAFLNIHRLNMTISLVAMVNYSLPTKNFNNTLQSCLELPYEDQDDNKPYLNKVGNEFDWSPELQGYILGSGFVGYSITQFLGGQLSEICGCKWIIFGGVLIASVTTLITPFVAWWTVYALIFVQTLRGLAQGVYEPAISVLIANWFPAMERGSLSAFIMSGYGAGALAGGLISGYLCEASFAGWPSVFYSCGAGGIVLALLIAAFLYENPSVHPKIHENELKFILSNQEAELTRKRPNTPWKSIFRSLPVHALSFAFFGQNWAAVYFLAIHPTFLGTILHFRISQNGFFTSVPFLLQTVFTLIASGVSRLMNKNNCISINKTRKIWTSMACLGFSACLLGIYFAGCNRTLNIVFSFIAMACLGFAYAGCIIASADMSPTFAGSISGVTCTFGTTAGFILPLIVGFFTEGQQTLEQWNKIMFLSIGVVMASGIVFCFFGSAEIQSWNYVSESGLKDEKAQNQTTDPDV